MKFFLSLLLLISLQGFAQDITIGSSLDHLLRLEPNKDSATNGMIRPYSISALQANRSTGLVKEFLGLKQNKALDLVLLPVEVQTAFVQHHPDQWNDGNMIPARGWQSMITGGLYIQKKAISLQLSPEWVRAQNKSYAGFPEDHDQSQWRDYYRWYNNIELPERISNGVYNKLLPGQSFLRASLGKIDVSISTQHLWWGPGYRNALLMSNAAAGFPHVSVKTGTPINTSWGKIEFEVMGGILTNANRTPPDTMHRAMGILLYTPKQRLIRVLSGSVLTYSPKWIKGLTLGVEQTMVQYQRDMKALHHYVPVQSPFNKIRKDNQQQQMLQTGLFIRYAIPNVDLEGYTELATNRSDRTLREFMVEPQAGAGSIYGIRKIIPTPRHAYYELIAEFTTVQQQLKGDILSAKSWYVHPYIRQGYTNEGQLLGATVGPGGKSQLVEVNWRSQLNRIGLSMERIQHNNDYMLFTFKNTSDFRRFWTDFVFSVKSDWKFKGLLAGLNLNFIKTNNYQWWLFEPSPGGYFIQGRDVYQLTARASIRYMIQ